MIDDYKKASGDVWKFFKKYFDGDGSDEYWREVIDKSNDIAEMYKDTELHYYVSKYLVLCVGVLNERQRNKAL